MATDLAVGLDPGTASPSRRKGRRGLAWQFARRVRRDPIAVTAAAIVIVVLVAAVAATSLRYSYAEQDLRHRSEQPSRNHLLGTDQLGRDVLARLAYGARVSLIVASAATTITLVIGVTVGATAGYAGGRIDAVLMRFVDAMYAFPDLLFVILVGSLIRGKVDEGADGLLRPVASLDHATNGLFPVFLALGLTSWLTTSRLVRAQMLALKTTEYVQASKGSGATGTHIIRRHLLPNTIAPLIVAGTLAIPNAILLEAGLSFIGLGVQPPMPSWGIMLSDGVASLRSFPHLMLFPAIAIGLTLLALNVLGDALRDAVDPLLQHTR